MIKKSYIIMALSLFFSSFVSYSQVLKPGFWKFDLQATHGTIPFIINFEKINDLKYRGILQNGKEQINLGQINLKNKKLSIPIQTYEVTLELDLLSHEKMSGMMVRHNKNPKIKIPVSAFWGEKERFPINKVQPSSDLSGKWAIKLIDENKKEEPGVLIFEQNQNHLYGSLLTITGDYRYFEGYISGNNFEVASFDGVYNYLIKGKVENDKIEAKVLSTYKFIIFGSKNENAQLPDAYKQTTLNTINFNFKDLSGKSVSLDNSQFKNKPVIIQFFGSWCPNCIDETNFLIPWYHQNKSKGIEIIALAFERSLNAKLAKQQLLKTQKKLKIPYTLLMAGSTSDDKPQDLIPGLKNFISFPTTIFLNKRHEVIKVHAGFTGPSTGSFFEKWKMDFNSTIDEVLK